MRTIECQHYSLRLCEHPQLVLGQFIKVVKHVHEQALFNLCRALIVQLTQPRNYSP